MKSEPYKYSWENLIRDGRTAWDGVRNYQARNNLRAMQEGDRAFFYHSNVGLCIIGVVEVTCMHYPDPTADDPQWLAVDVRPLFPLKTPVPLTQIKAHPLLQQMGLVRQQRLSVSAVSPQEWEVILQLGGSQSIDHTPFHPSSGPGK